MPAITSTLITGTGTIATTETTLDGATDGLTYNPSTNPILTLRNPTVGALTPTIVGSAATTVAVAGVGSVSVASGYSVGSIAAGATKTISLNTIREYLKGTITITGGTGLVATLLEGQA